MAKKSSHRQRTLRAVCFQANYYLLTRYTSFHVINSRRRYNFEMFYIQLPFPLLRDFSLPDSARSAPSVSSAEDACRRDGGALAMPFRQGSRDVKWNKLLTWANSAPFQASSLGAGPKGGHRDRKEEEEESGDAGGRGGGRRILDRPPVKKAEFSFPLSFLKIIFPRLFSTGFLLSNLFCVVRPRLTFRSTCCGTRTGGRTTRGSVWRCCRRCIHTH